MTENSKILTKYLLNKWKDEKKKCPKDSKLPESLFYSESHFYHDFLKLNYLCLFHKNTEYSLANLLCFYTVEEKAGTYQPSLKGLLWGLITHSDAQMTS